MLRADKLDDAFLFVLAVGTLGFTITQTTIGGINGLVSAVPVLLSGVALPFYVGYFRGAVLLDSGLERIRGWVILVMGNFVMLSLVVTDYAKQSLALYVISVVGLAVAIFFGTKLVTAYPLAPSRRTNLVIAGGAATGYFFPIVDYLIASLIEVAWGVPLIQLVAFYLIFLYLTLVFASIFVAAERTCEALASDRPLVEYGSGKPNRLDRALNRLSKRLFFSPVDYGMVAIDSIYREKKVVLLWLASIFVLVLAGDSINWFHNNWLLVGTLALAADMLIALSIAFYVRISPDAILTSATPNDRG